MTVTANPVETNLLEAVRWARLSQAFYYLSEHFQFQMRATSWQLINTSFADFLVQDPRKTSY